MNIKNWVEKQVLDKKKADSNIRFNSTSLHQAGVRFCLVTMVGAYGSGLVRSLRFEVRLRFELCSGREEL